MADVSTIEVAASIRLEFAKRIGKRAEEGRWRCSAKYKCTKCNTRFIYASACEARRR